MFSTPKPMRSLLLLAFVSVFVVIAGCTRNAPRRPFADVTDAERNDPTFAQEQPGPAADTAATTTDVVTSTTEQTPPADQPTETTTTTTTTAANDPVVTQPEAVLSAPRATTSPAVTGPEIPLVVDRIGAVRQWPLVTGYRPSGNVVAFPTYWESISREPERSETRQAIREPFLFLYNVVVLPIRAIRTPPLTRVTYDPATEQDEPRVPYELETPYTAEAPVDANPQ